MPLEQSYDVTPTIAASWIHASHFFAFYDEDFLIEVYDKLLKRKPDPTGIATYLPLIRSGETRYRVLDAISRSPEAGAIGVRVFGMKPYRRMRRLRRIPVAGRMVDAALILWHANDLMRDLRAFETHIYRISKKIEL
jgi:Domain of unknown function (DUF4214)